MKKVLSTFFVLIALQSIAQDNQKYIEVSVTDTMSIAPELYLYQISVADTAYYGDYGATGGTDYDYNRYLKKREKEQSEALDILEELLQKEKIKFRKEQDGDFNLKPVAYYNVKSLLAEFKTIDQIRKFNTKIKELNVYEGKLVEMKSSKTAAAEKELLKNALKKATEKAEFLAATMNVKLGKVLWFREDFNNNLNVAANIPAYSGEYHFLAITHPYIKLEKNITVRFNLVE